MSGDHVRRLPNHVRFVDWIQFVRAYKPARCRPVDRHELELAADDLAELLTAAHRRLDNRHIPPGTASGREETTMGSCYRVNAA